ncbi:hypothetical protein SLA2020_401930 [Shorea laevis]
MTSLQFCSLSSNMNCTAPSRTPHQWIIVLLGKSYGFELAIETIMYRTTPPATPFDFYPSSHVGVEPACKFWA